MLFGTGMKWKWKNIAIFVLVPVMKDYVLYSRITQRNQKRTSI